MKTPNVEKCDVTDCAYNDDCRCHAAAITVGGPAPCCDMFTDSPIKGGAPEAIGNISECNVDDCSFNEMLKCMAKGIVVSRRSCYADCLTFKSKKGGVGYV